MIDGILSPEKKKVDRSVIINGAELKTRSVKDKSPRELMAQIMILLDDSKARHPPELEKPKKKNGVTPLMQRFFS